MKPKLQILVVEADNKNLASAQNGLTHANVGDVRYATNSDDAVDIINSNLIDVVIVNENISDRDGFNDGNRARWVKLAADLNGKIYLVVSQNHEGTIIRSCGITRKMEYSLREPEAWKNLYFMLLKKYFMGK